MVGKDDDPASYWVSVTFQRRLLLNFGRVVGGLGPILGAPTQASNNPIHKGILSEFFKQLNAPNQQP